jgi:transcriptional regulator with XRE-family HTH domain
MKKDIPTAPFLKQLGDRFRQLRIAQGYSNYEQFAFDNELPRAQYGRYEQGKDLRFSSLVKVLKAFDISLKDFFSEGFEDEGHQQKKIIFEDDFFSTV